jgi:multimeric flavodoxin WrbA
MGVLGIVGSPRKDGRSNQLVDAALKGVSSKDFGVKKIYLVDYEVKSYTGTGDDVEVYTFCPEELSNICEEADAIILGAPVYWGDINGLTKDFMDTVRISDSNGKPALGIAIAGNTGKGLLSGIQTIYHYFYHKQMRGIDPTPVSRFNFQEALAQLEKSGSKLAELSKMRTPFPGESRDERWSEVLAYYANLDYLTCDPVDEFLMLVEQLIKISKGNEVKDAKYKLNKAYDLISKGKRSEAARHTVEAYQILYYSP